MTTNPQWDTALKTYLGRSALVELETEIGEISITSHRYTMTPRDTAAQGAHNRALARLAEQFTAPLKEAAIALIAVPAPDLAGATLKREVAAKLLKGHPELLAAAYSHITADIERLTGVVSAPDQRAAA